MQKQKKNDDFCIAPDCIYFCDLFLVAITNLNCQTFDRTIMCITLDTFSKNLNTPPDVI